MKLLAVLIPLTDALYRGRQLTHVETWKVAGTGIAALSAFLTALAGVAVAMGWFAEIPAKTILEVSNVLGTLVFTVLGYLQVATTEKIGFSGPVDGDKRDVDRMYNTPVSSDGPDDSPDVDRKRDDKSWFEL